MPEMRKILAINFLSRMIRRLLLSIFLATQALAGEPWYAETELVPEEMHSERLLFLDKPMLRLGEVVHLLGNPERMAVVWNYKWTGRAWVYRIRGARYQK